MPNKKSAKGRSGLLVILALCLLTTTIGCHSGQAQTTKTNSSSELITFLPEDQEYSPSVSQKISLREDQGGGEVLVTCKINDYRRKDTFLEVNIVVENNSDQSVTLKGNEVRAATGERALTFERYECSTDRTLRPSEVTGCRVFFAFSTGTAEAAGRVEVVFDLLVGSEKHTIKKKFKIDG